MKFILLISFILISIVYDTSATTYNCWNPTLSTPASVATGSSGAHTFCKYTLSYGSGWLASNWATYAYSTDTSCTASTTLTCVAAHDDTGPAAATVANLPTISSCYTGTTLTATTLTSQAQTACASTSYFCQATFTGVSGSTATGFTSGCQATQCTSTSSLLCSMAANTNQVLGCYTGYAYTTGTSTWTKTICAPISSASAAYCQNDYSWTSTYGTTITGSCVASCSAATISLTGTAATTGRTCSSTVYGNTYSGSDASIQFSLIAMVLSSIMGLLVIHV